MNARQFINSTLCAAADKVPILKSTLFLFPRFFFPEFLKGARVNEIKNPFILGITIYLIVFFFVFVVQGFLSGTHDAFFLSPNIQGSCFSEEIECLRYFLGDYANIVNYTIIVEAYCISGSFFLIYANNIERLLITKGLSDHIDCREQKSSFIGGAFSVFFVLFFSLAGAAGYAIEIESYPPHWYMNSPSGPTSYSGYYYIFINFVLLLFVAFVGVAHFGLFKTASTLSKGLRSIRESGNLEAMEQWVNDDKVKLWFSPFATQVLISKVFILSLILNLVSWKMWEPNIGEMHTISVIVMVVTGMWIVTLPRYYIQYQLFEIRKACGVFEYKDIRTPWILGGSALVDILLAAIVVNYLLNENSIFELFDKIINL